MKLIYAAFCVVLALLVATSLAADPAPFPVSNCVNIPITKAKEFGDYYYVTAEATTRELYVTMRTAVDGLDVDLYIRADHVPDTEMYDDADLSTNNFVEMYHRPDTVKAGTRFYIGVYSFSGVGDVEVCARVYDCINRNCGSSGAENAGTCVAESGECQCHDGFDGPGCAYKIAKATPDVLYTNSLKAYSTVGYVFDVADDSLGSYLHFQVSRTELNSWLTLRARQGAVPTEDETDFDAHLTPNTPVGHLHINRRNFNPGKWYVTISSESVPSDVLTTSFDFIGHLYLCPSNCSGKGECEAETRKCKCDPDYDAASDCSLYSKLLRPGSTLDLTVEPSGSTSFYFEVSQAESLRNVDFAIHFETNKDMASARYPRMYIARGDPTVGRRASRDRYIAASPEPPERYQTVHISDHDALGEKFQGIIYNDYSDKVDGKLSITLTAYCPNDCSGNGECLSTGVCQCVKGFHSNDCSVSSEVCKTKMGSKDSGVPTLITVFVIIGSMAIAAIAGPFLFKYCNERKRSAEGRPPRRAVPDSADDNQYSELS